MVTSIGYHTFTIYRTLTKKDARLLYQHFKNDTEVFIIPPRDKTTMISNENQWLNSKSLKFHNIKYHRPKGISWVLKFDKRSVSRFDTQSRPCSIKAIINPKLLAGIQDYVTAADESYLDMVKTNFNQEASRISPILKTFDMYLLNRIDYCINFDLQELGIDCNPDQMMTLLKRGYLPSNLVERMEYDPVSRRYKTGKNLYLQNKSVTINCYGKHDQLVNEFHNCPNIEDAKQVVRFEIQCLYPKVYIMSKAIKDSNGWCNIIRQMLSDEVSESTINKYYNQIIGKGNFFTLELAKSEVESHHFTLKKTYRLISALELVNRCRGISKAMDSLMGKDLEDFKRSIRELNYIGVNPVTIPKEWGVKRIKNLITAYYDMIAISHRKEVFKEQESKLLDDYFHDLRKNKKKY